MPPGHRAKCSATRRKSARPAAHEARPSNDRAATRADHLPVQHLSQFFVSHFGHFPLLSFHASPSPRSTVFSSRRRAFLDHGETQVTHALQGRPVLAGLKLDGHPWRRALSCFMPLILQRAADP